MEHVENDLSTKNDIRPRKHSNIDQALGKSKCRIGSSRRTQSSSNVTKDLDDILLRQGNPNFSFIVTIILYLVYKPPMKMEIQMMN